MFFWWKKYEGNGLATTISMLGTIIVTIGSMGIIGMLSSLLGEGVFFTVISFVVGIIVFILLKVLLNKLTDKLDAKITLAQVEISQRYDNKKKSKQSAIINEGTNQKKLYKMIKRMSVIELNQMVEAIRKLTDQSLVNELIRYTDRQNRSFTDGQLVRSEHFFAVMTELINRITDENERRKQRERYDI